MSHKKKSRLWMILLFAAVVLLAPMQAPADEPPEQEEPNPAEQPDEAADAGITKPASGLVHPFTEDVKQYIDKGRYDSGIYFLWNEETDEKLKGILNINPGDAKAWYTLCYLYTKTGEYNKVFEAVEKAKKHGAYGSRVQLIHAEMLYHTGKIKEAEKIFESILAAHPAFHKARLDLADLLYNSGELEEAKKLYSKLAVLNPEDYKLNSEVLYCIGRGQQLLKKYNDANQMYKKACDIDPGFEEAWAARAQMHFDLFDLPNAYYIINQLLDYNWRSVQGRVITAKCIMQTPGQDPYGMAEIELQTALRRNPGSLEALEFAIYFYTFTENFDKAQEHLDRALEINPKSIAFLSQAGFLYYLSGQNEKFAEIEKKVKELNPHCAEFYYAVGGVMDRKYGFKFAVEYCKKAIEANPDFEPAYPVLGRNLLFIGKEEEGEKILRRAWKGTGGFSTRIKNLLIAVDRINNEFETRKSEHFIIRMDKLEMPVLGPYAEFLLEDAWDKLGKKYNLEPEGPIVVLIFRDGEMFSVRTAGVPGLGFALGASFGTALTARSPLDLRGPAQMPYLGSWAQVVYHEFTHIITLQQSNSRTSRWLTEGLSEMEQRLKSPAWGRENERIGDARFVPMLMANRLIPVTQLDAAFLSHRVLDAYYQARIMADYIRETYGYEKIIAMNKEYAKRRTTAQMIKAVFDMATYEFDEAFRKWALDKYKNFGLGPRYDKEALDELRKQVQKRGNYRNAQLHADVAIAYLQNKDEKKAKKYLEKALRLDPDNSDACMLKGMLAARDKQIDEAITLLNKALELDAKDKASIYATLAQIYLPSQENPKGDKTEYEKYLHLYKEAFPTNASAIKALADIYSKAGRNEESLKLKEEYLNLVDTDVGAREAMLEIYKQRGDDEKVAQMYKEIHWVDPYKMRTHMPAALAFEKVGWYGYAAVEYEVAAVSKVKEQLPEILYTEAARCYIKVKKFDSARRVILKALEIDPAFPEAKKLKKIIEKESSRPDIPSPESPGPEEPEDN